MKRINNQMDKTEQNSNQKIRKTLGEPIFDGFTENDHRIRRNLLLFSALANSIIFYDLQISNNESFLGLPLKGFSVTELKLTLLIFIIYHASHFLTIVSQFEKKWRLRLTGKDLKFITSQAGTWGEDKSRENETLPSQTTLYSWWVDKAPRFADYCEEFIKNQDTSEKKKNKLSNNLFTVRDFLNDSLIKERLSRFDDCFWNHQRKQRLFWIIWEIGLPFLFALIAIIGLIHPLLVSLIIAKFPQYF